MKESDELENKKLELKRKQKEYNNLNERIENVKQNFKDDYNQIKSERLRNYKNSEYYEKFKKLIKLTGNKCYDNLIKKFKEEWRTFTNGIGKHVWKSDIIVCDDKYYKKILYISQTGVGIITPYSNRGDFSFFCPEYIKYIIDNKDEVLKHIKPTYKDKFENMLDKIKEMNVDWDSLSKLNDDNYSLEVEVSPFNQENYDGDVSIETETKYKIELERGSWLYINGCSLTNIYSKTLFDVKFDEYLQRCVNLDLKEAYEKFNKKLTDEMKKLDEFEKIVNLIKLENSASNIASAL